MIDVDRFKHVIREQLEAHARENNDRERGGNTWTHTEFSKAMLRGLVGALQAAFASENLVATGQPVGCLRPREQLYDLAFSVPNDPERPAHDPRTQDVVCVLESELAFAGREYEIGDGQGCKNEIAYDFQKLLLAQAPLRVMIFQGEPEFVNEMVEELHSQSSRFTHRAPGLFLLAGFTWSRDADGKVNAHFQFREFEESA